MSSPSSSRHPARLSGFLGGVFLTQIVDSALHLAQPLLLAKISGSLGGAAFFSAFDTAVHMAGTYLGGWPTDRFGARRVLVAATFLRAVALAWIPVMMIGGFMNLWLAMGCYTVEAMIRGFVDASVHTVPLELARHRKDDLDRINSRYELTFDLGGVAGPLMLGGLMIWGDKVIPHIIIPVGFVLSAGLYLFIPGTRGGGMPGQASPHGHRPSGGSWAGIKQILTHRPLLIACAGLMSFSIYPLRKLLSAFFAKGLLHKSSSVGHIGAAFALGGVVGALIYARTKHRGSGALWVALGAAGTFLLAVGWMPSDLWVMVAAVFLFGVANVCARLSLTRKRQELTPLEHAGGVTSASQFGVNAVSVVMKTVVGASFSLGFGAYGAFGIIGVILGLLAAGQFFLARFLARSGQSGT
jgi:MFS family permease